MDAVTPKGEAQAGVEGHSHIVRPAEMEWQKTSFPGCEAKPLYVDAKTGIATLLMKFEPGAVLPDHEHVHGRADLRDLRQAGRQGRRRPRA